MLYRINEINKYTINKIKIEDKFNGVQVTNFHNSSTERLNYRIYARPQSIKQARRPDFYKYTRLPVTRWVKLSLNFELLLCISCRVTLFFANNFLTQRRINMKFLHNFFQTLK